MPHSVLSQYFKPCVRLPNQKVSYIVILVPYLWRALLWWGQLLVLWLLLLLVLDGLLGCISDPAKVVHDTTLGLVATGHTAGLVLAGVALAAGGLRLLKCLVVSAAEVSHLFLEESAGSSQFFVPKNTCNHQINSIRTGPIK